MLPVPLRQAFRKIIGRVDLAYTAIDDIQIVEGILRFFGQSENDKSIGRVPQRSHVFKASCVMMLMFLILGRDSDKTPGICHGADGFQKPFFKIACRLIHKKRFIY